MTQAIHALQLLEPLYNAVTFIMLAFHDLLQDDRPGPGRRAGPGAAAIVGLVIVIRILLIPLFVKQINAQRGLQMLQPEIKKIQAKYKGKTDPESGRSSSKR